MDSPGFRSSSTPLPRPLDQPCSFLEPLIPHLNRCSWTCRNIRVLAARSALRVLVLSFCARLTQLAWGEGKGGDRRTQGTGQVHLEAKAAVC